MALNTAGLNYVLSTGSFASAAVYIALHTADPGTTGLNPASSARVAASWGAASGGVVTAAANLAFTGGAANGPVTHAGYWSASSGGTFYGSQALTGDATFNSAGQYTVTSLTETAS
jgi:hypothetical protein